MASFAERLANKESLFGTIVSINSPAIVELMSGRGFDWLFIDAEHGALAIDSLENLVRASRIPVLLRIPNHSESAVKQALEIGVHGIIVPQVNSAEEAAKIVRYAKYPPLGARGVGVGRASDYGMALADYLGTANSETVVVAQVEHIDAVQCVEEIVATPGLAAILVGPNDLASSMNLLGQTGHPEVIAAIDKVRLAAQAVGLAAGIFHGDPTTAIAFNKQGFNLVACGVDSIILGQAAHNLAQQLSAGSKSDD